MGPEELARYRLKRVLGRGGRPGLFGGEVWEAEDAADEGRVALKILRVDDEEMLAVQARFVHDAQAVAGLRHPNVARVRDTGEAGGTSFLVMDLVEGRTLRAASWDPDVAIEDKVRWLREIALGLGAIHDLDVAHRDVKAENVIVRADGTACLVDLGVPFDTGRGEPDARDDQAAWAEMARELLGAEAPEDVARVLDRAAAPDRDSRYPSMRDVATALAREAPAVDPAAPGRRDGTRRTWHPAVAVVALGVLIALAALLQRLLLD